MPFDDVSLIYDDQATAEASLAGVAALIPGWTPADGHVETSLAEAFAIAIATAAIQFRDELKEQYANGFGRDVLEITRDAPTSASTTATWTFTNTNPVTIPGGTQLSATTPTGDPAGFVVPADTFKAAGLTSISTAIIALEPGVASNDAAGTGDSPYVGDVANPLVSVALDAPSAGGVDEQDVDAWITEVRRTARRLHKVPITPADHADHIIDIPGVSRAHVENRYNPATAPADAPGHVTFWAIDAAGMPVDSPTKTAILADLNAYDRPLAVTYHAVDVPSVTLTLALTVKADATADPTQVAADVKAAVLAAFDRSTWDADSEQPGGWVGNTLGVAPTSSVTIYDVSAAADDVPGVHKVTAVTVNGGTTAVALPAPVTMPNLPSGNVTVTVT